ncbi:MAG: hypothetical protein DCC68_01530 [Planctomycetota bacterium]|nr:MAG: hypothetical protein DCC68_01530 [Planctomycetota bacterium]
MQNQGSLTPEESQQLQDLLERCGIKFPVVSHADNLPGAFEWLGMIGRNIVVRVILGAGVVAGGVEILLIPKNAEEVVSYYTPVLDDAYSATKQVVLGIRQGILDAVPGNPTNQYVAFIEGGEAKRDTGPFDESNWRQMTMVSSPTVPPHVVGGSGIIEPPYRS